MPPFPGVNQDFALSATTCRITFARRHCMSSAYVHFRICHQACPFCRADFTFRNWGWRGAVFLSVHASTNQIASGQDVQSTEDHHVRQKDDAGWKPEDGQDAGETVVEIQLLVEQQPTNLLL